MNSTNKFTDVFRTLSTGAAIGFLIGGTGSLYPLENVSRWKPHLEQRCALGFENANLCNIDTRNVSEHIENIRAILCPSMADLANLLDVSRQAVYKWIAQDAHPESDKLESIKTLSNIADTLRETGINRTGILLKMKNSQGISLFDLIKNKGSYEEQLKILIVEAKAMEASYLRSGLSQSKAKPSNDWLSTISIPSYPEEL